MIDFDEVKMIEKADELYALRGELERIADKICEKEISNILFTSSGGSLCALEPFCYMIKSMSKIPAYSEISAELILTGNPLINEHTVAFLTSKSGDTMETVAAAKWLKEKGVTVISACGVPDSPLEKESSYAVMYGDADPHDLTFLFLIGRMLYNKGDFPKYPQFADELKNLGKVLAAVSRECDDYARAYAEQFREKDLDYQMWVSSGNTWGHTYSMAMCILEECQWLRTKSIHSAEFFHGTIELVEKGVCVAVGMGEGPTRPLDERVIRFVQKHTDNMWVFDTKKYAFPGISDEFRWLLSPVVIWNIYTRIFCNLAVVRCHTMDIRRYYRRLEY